MSIIEEKIKIYIENYHFKKTIYSFIIYFLKSPKKVS